jgi:hypothetical protein
VNAIDCSEDDTGALYVAMGRPMLADRDLVKGVVMTLKLSGPERARLDKLVDARSAEIQKLTGQRIELSLAAYIRWLFDRDAEARGIPLEEEAPSEPRLQKPLDPDDIRASVRAAVKGGRSQGAIAKAAGVDAGQLSRFVNKGEGLGEDKLRAVAKAAR